LAEHSDIDSKTFNFDFYRSQIEKSSQRDDSIEYGVSEYEKSILPPEFSFKGEVQ